MNASMSTEEFDDRDLTAAEYVLGVLDADALRSARRRIRTEPAFAQDVSAWELHFMPWIDAIDPVTAPENAWARVCNTLGWSSAARDTAAIRAPVRPDRVPFWRGLAFAGFAAAAVCAVVMMGALNRAPVQVQLPAPPPLVTTQLVQPDRIAAIAGDDGRALFMASIDSRTGKMLLSPIDAGITSVPAGSVPELWVIPPGGAPQSLGVIDPTHAQALSIPAALRAGFGADALVAVSVEPPGGSPTGAPTGAVIAKGVVYAI